jgi:isopenicillin N synthase-like dioxygenase
MVAALDAEEAVPVLDLGPYLANESGALEETAASLRIICENIGFLVVTSHGVPAELIASVFTEAARFHALPLVAKLRLDANAVTCSYVPLHASTTRASALANSRKPNENEILFIRRRRDHAESAGEWPDLPGFRETVLAYYDAVQALAQRLLPLYARALDLPATFFDGLFDHPLSALRLNHYPAHDYAEGEYGIAPHTDSTFITLLAQDGIPGLKVQAPSGRWIDAPLAPDSFVINTGDLLNLWSNGRFLSTPHYASNRPGRARHSIPYTFHPSAETVISALPGSLAPGETSRFEPVATGEYLAWYRQQNYDHLRPRADNQPVAP